MKRLSAIILGALALAFSISPARATVTTTPIGTGGGGGIASNAIANLNGLGTNTSFFSTVSTLPSITFKGGTLGLGTNENLGEVWANDFGFSYTNSAAGNSNAFNLAVQALTNLGGGILRYGSKFTNWSGAAQVINITGDHMLPAMTYPGRIKLQGDGSTIINFTGTSTTNAVFFGQFDAEDVKLTGPRTVNNSDVYPYTNLVGFLEVGFFDPQLTKCYAKGFGQGLAAVQTGSFRGMQVLGCHFEGNDIGVALGDACDQTLLKGTDCRQALWGLDIGCIVPVCTNAFPNLTGAMGTTNVGPSRFVRVDGGIWDYNSNACIVIGKGYLQAGFYAGNEHNYQMCLGHPTNMISIAGAPGAYQNETGGNVVDLNGCWWLENDVATNIFVTPQASGQPVLKIKNTFMGGNYGVVGLVSYVEWDQNMQNPGASTNYFPFPGIANGFNYPYANVGGIFQAPQTYAMGFDEAGGAYANSTALYSVDYHTGTSDVLPLWRVHNTDFSRVDRMYVQIDSLGGNTYGLDLHNTAINTDGTNAGAYGYFTNNIFANTNTAKMTVLSNLNVSAGQYYTNIYGFRISCTVPYIHQLFFQAAGSGDCHSVCDLTNLDATFKIIQMSNWVNTASAVSNTIAGQLTFRMSPGSYFQFNGGVSGAHTIVNNPTGSFDNDGL